MKRAWKRKSETFVSRIRHCRNEPAVLSELFRQLNFVAVESAS